MVRIVNTIASRAAGPAICDGALEVDAAYMFALSELAMCISYGGHSGSAFACGRP
jgi:hypothetical protein